MEACAGGAWVGCMKTWSGFGGRGRTGGRAGLKLECVAPLGGDSPQLLGAQCASTWLPCSPSRRHSSPSGRGWRPPGGRGRAQSEAPSRRTAGGWWAGGRAAPPRQTGGGRCRLHSCCTSRPRRTGGESCKHRKHRSSRQPRGSRRRRAAARAGRRRRPAAAGVVEGRGGGIASRCKPLLRRCQGRTGRGAASRGGHPNQTCELEIGATRRPNRPAGNAHGPNTSYRT